MGLFKRNSQRSASDKDEHESFMSVNSARTSNTSLRSPGYKGSGLPASIPEVPISKPPDPALDPAAYLRSIHAVRERASIVLDKAKRDELNHFDVDLSKFKATASYVVSIIKVTTAVDAAALGGMMLTSDCHRETMPPITRTSHHTAAGSTSTWVGGRGSTSFCNRGPDK